ncbi:TolC family outer membrane protein [Halomonas sp. HP20-15]|uniref:TolC family outer membrane protein n=1 Tax=Halomonas sp. HP20-15 TaxID=3085901 RepID=UPI00298183AA|nr:TolC family outer membrane protein [Halomonas sp. HP20-15]MDW5378231.1 TolC family outer membrane protein [Halomonas sp. HP20-15]
MSTRRLIGSGLVMLGQLAAPLAVAQSTSVMDEVDALPALDGRLTAASDASIPASEQGAGERKSLPSLPRLFALALENDAELASQRYNAQATSQQVPMAEAGLKPQIQASAGYTYQESDNYYTDNPAYNPDNELSGAGDDYDARYRGITRDKSWQVQLSQSLFSLERWRKVDKAEAQSGAAQLQVAVAERDLALQVAEAYLDAFLASRKLGLLASKQQSLTLQAKQAQRAYDLGIGDRINLLESQARLDQAVADAVRAENELNNALSSLERLTGALPQFEGSELGDLSRLSLPGEWDEADPWLERTVNNVEVALGKQQMEIARVDTRVRHAGHYPELNLNLAYSDRGSNDPYRDSEDASASLRLNVPIYQGGYTSASVKQGELAQRASQAAYTHALNLARQEVRQRLRSLKGDERQIEALKRSIESSRLFLQAAEKGEQLGLRDLVDVLDARANLYDLRIQFVQVVRQYLLDRLNLQAAVGDLGTQDLVDAMALLRRIVQPA